MTKIYAIFQLAKRKPCYFIKKTPLKPYLRPMLNDLLALWPLLLLVLLALAASEWLLHTQRLPYWASRKLLHAVAVGACAVAPQWVANPLSLVAIVLPFWLVLLFVVARKGWMRDTANGRPAWGIIWFPLAYMLLLLGTNAEDSTFGIVFPMAVLAVCDPMATLAGKCFAKRQYVLTGDPKSWIGNGAFLLSFLFLARWMELPLPWEYIFAMAILVTIVEALGSEGLDNLYIPLLTAFLWWASQVEGIPLQPFLFWLLLLLFLAPTAYRGGYLTAGGAATALLLGMVVLATAKPVLLFPLLFFFGSSVLLSRLFPSSLPSDEKDKKARDAAQVLANGGWYGLLVVLSIWWQYRQAAIGEAFPMKDAYWLLWISATMATADTWSSEWGKYTAGKTYDMLRFRPVSPGLSGGVSWQGSLAGLVAALCMASLYCLLLPAQATGPAVAMIVVFGWLGMWIDSALGATIQRQFFDGNEWRDTPPSHGQVEATPPSTLPASPIQRRGYTCITNDAVNALANLLGLLVAVAYLWLR